jgi:flavin reductase (DIM6/NTAB) family NADH-FMN oxidoreductase RutF
VVTGDDLREAMRRFPTGVAIVTVAIEETELGLTVGSLVSVSLEPPLVSMAIGVHTPLHEPLREAGAFAASLLADDQEQIAQHFARNPPPIAAWAGIETRPSEVGPLLADALAWLECRVAAEYPAGDHTLFVGEVERIEVGRTGRALGYRERRYVPVD